MDGLIAAYIAKSGFRGPKDVIGGDRGFLFVMGNENSNLQIHKKGQLEIERIYQKKYASCRYCHAPIEAVLKI